MVAYQVHIFAEFLALTEPSRQYAIKYSVLDFTLISNDNYGLFRMFLTSLFYSAPGPTRELVPNLLACSQLTSLLSLLCLSLLFLLEPFSEVICLAADVSFAEKLTLAWIATLAVASYLHLEIIAHFIIRCTTLANIVAYHIIQILTE